MARKINCFTQLQAVASKIEGASCAIILPGVGASGKDIYWQPEHENFMVINLMDGGSEQFLTWEELFDEKKSCIGSAIRTGAFIFNGDELLPSDLIQLQSEIGTFYVDPFTQYVINPYSRISESFASQLDLVESIVPDIITTPLSPGIDNYHLNDLSYTSMSGKIIECGEYEELYFGDLISNSVSF